jgi:NADH-quinone oxidoreductase subunit M
MLSPDQIRSFLPLVLGLPLLSALVVLTSGQRFARARCLALVLALAHLVLTGLMVISAAGPLADRVPATVGVGPIFLPDYVPGDPGSSGLQQPLGGHADPDAHTTTIDILPFSIDNPKLKPIQFYIGLDGLNLWMVALCSLMMVPVIIASWAGIRESAGAYYAWLFALQAGAIGVFLAFDVMLFYVCFELTLIPLFFLIGSWGVGPTRREAARKLFLYTLAGGLITLLGIAGTVFVIYNQTGVLTFSIPELSEKMAGLMRSPDTNLVSTLKQTQMYLFAALVVGFAVKIPLVPVHTWLPGAYAEAPMGVTMMLSAILAKMGTFGLLRVCLPLAPDATLTVGLPLIGVLASIGIVYGALCAFAQPDFKKLIAYSSVSHLGFCALALVAFNAEGLGGGMLHMVNHGLSTGAMFLLAGLMIDRYGTSRIVDYSGMWAKLPQLTFFMMVVCLASVGLPGLNNFVSEMMMLFGLFNLRGASGVGVAFAVVAGLGIFLGAWYTLTFLQRAFFGPLREPPAAIPGTAVKDLNRLEFYGVMPLALLCLVLGVMPNKLLRVMDRDVHALAKVAEEARERGQKPTPASPQPNLPPAK